MTLHILYTKYPNHRSPQVRLVQLIAHVIVCLDQGQTELGGRKATYACSAYEYTSVSVLCKLIHL